MRIQALLVVTALSAGSTAHALNQSKHFDVTVQSCGAAGLPYAFCQRVGTEVYNVDANEFDDLSAHSQIPVGSTACDAANSSLWRVFWLGGQLREAAITIGYSASRSGNDTVAQHLGRALHTVQDNCAHSGMPNPQHAWHSLSDVCQGTTESPDLNPAAFACARSETDSVFSAFIDVLHDNGGDFAELANVTTDNDKHWPAYSSVCEFLGSASDWKGEDRRWDNAIVRPALTAQLVQGLSGADASQYTRVCGDDSDGVLLSYSEPDRDTDGGPQSCLKIHAFCLGKADSAVSEAPPYETDPVAPEDTVAPVVVTGGCQVGGSSPSSATALLLVAAAIALFLRTKAS